MVLKIDPILDKSRGLPWLVSARNECQSLLLQLLQRWDAIDKPLNRQLALAAAFSLWRAVFLLVKADLDKPIDSVDVHAKRFLDRVIRTNAIGFGDEMSYRAWSGPYYVENAISRIEKLTGHQFGVYHYSPIGSVRDAWNEAFAELKEFVGGTLPDTLELDPTTKGD